MAKLYYRYGTGKTSDLCQTAYNFNERGMKTLIINADNNKNIEAKVMVNGQPLLSREPNFILDNNRLFLKLYEMDKENIECILVDNAHLLTNEQAEDLFYISKLFNITVISYGERTCNDKATEGAMRLMELSNIIEPVDGEEMISRPNLQFYYGAMNCSKTAKLLYKSFSLKQQGMNVCIIKPKLDRDALYIESRIGLKEKADYILDTNDHIFGEGFYMQQNRVNYILVDEAQFLSINQINELAKINQHFNIPIRFYGLKADFMTNHFPGSGRLLEICDELIKLRTVCKCGDGADFNARMYNGRFVKSGNQVCIDDGKDYTYMSLCADCYIKEVQGIENSKKLVKELSK